MFATIYIYLQDTGPANQLLQTKTSLLYPKLNGICTGMDATRFKMNTFSSLQIITTYYMYTASQKTPTLYSMNNSVKNKPIRIIFGTRNTEEI